MLTSKNKSKVEKAAKTKKNSTPTTRRVVGVEFDSSAIRTVLMEEKNGTVKLSKFHEEVLEEYTVRAGDVSNIDDFSSSLKKIWKEQKYDTREVAIAVSTENSLAFVQIMEDEKDFASTLPFRIPVGTLDANEYYLGFHNLDFFREEERDTSVVGGMRMVNKRSILLVGVKKESADPLIAACKKAKLYPSNLDMCSLAIVRSSPVSTDGEGISAYINVDHDNLTVVIADHGQPVIVRIVPTGGSYVTNALISKMEIDMSYAHKLQHDAQFIKASDMVEQTDAQFPNATSENSQYSEDQMTAYNIIQQEITDMIENINMTIDFYFRRASATTNAMVNEYIVSGTSRVAQNIHDRLSAESDGKVRISDPRSGFSGEKTLTVENPPEHLESFASAIGMVIASGEVQN